jgi:hypothetical protein
MRSFSGGFSAFYSPIIPPCRISPKQGADLLRNGAPISSEICTKTLFEKFLRNGGEIEMTSDSVWVRMKKKRNLPGLLNAMESFHHLTFPWMAGKSLRFVGSSTT